MSKNLQIEVLKSSVNGEVYDAAMGCLILQNSDKAFTFKIKEMPDFAPNKPVAPKLMKELNEKEFYALSIESRWAHNAKIKEQDEKVNAYNTKHDEYNKKIKVLRASVSWAWQLVGNGVNPKTISPNASFTKGITKDKAYSLKFPKIAEGGGLVWLEVFTDDYPALGRPPFGMFVQAKGIPKIIRVEWTDQNYNPIPDTKILAFGSQVLLHVYTNGMYGQEVEIELFDKDIFSGDDCLSIGDKKAFTREIIVQEIKPFEKGKHGNSGFLIASKQNENNKVIEGDTVVQKIEVKVSIQKNWIKDGGTELKIYPAIKSLETGNSFTGFTRQFLTVKENGIMYNVPAKPTNNTPGMVGSVETNVATFKPCRYDKITLMQQKKAGSTIVFNSGDNMQRAKKVIAIEIVAGKKETYMLDFDLQTVECERKPKHTTKEITILSIPKEYELKIDPSSKAEHKIKKEEKELVKTELKSSSSTSHMDGLKTTQKETISEEKGIVTVRQKQIEFDAFYNYDIPMDSVTTFPKALKYFWLPDLSEDKISKITALSTSCAFQQNINITIYPDIKWSLIFGFNVKKDQLAELIPSWDREKTIKKFEWKAGKFSEKFGAGIDEKTKDRINKQALDTYKDVYGTPKVEPGKDKDTNKKGKLDTLLDIMKNVDVSLKAQIYGENELELTRKFFENSFNSMIYKDIYEKLRWAVDMMDGKLDNPKNKAEGDKAINDFLSNNELSNRTKHLKEALTRPAQEVEILFPKVSLGGDWQYDKVDAAKYPALAGRSGLAYNIALITKPLIGMEIKWHILDLLCRKHPIAYAVLAAIKTLLTALGDNPDGIKVDFWVKGQIDADVKFKGNYLSKDNQIATRGETHITAGVEISIMLIGKVIKGKYTAIAELGVGGKGEVGLGLEGSLGVDDQGIWLQTSLIFDGIKLSFEAVVSARVVKNRVKDDGTVEEVKIIGGEEKIEGEITMLTHTFKSEKFYLNN